MNAPAATATAPNFRAQTQPTIGVSGSYNQTLTMTTATQDYPVWLLPPNNIMRGIALEVTATVTHMLAAHASFAQRFARSVIEPLQEFASRRGAAVILLFIVLFRLGEALAGTMLPPFYHHLGFNRAQVALANGPISLAAVLIGAALGGIVWYAYPRGAEKYTNVDVPTVKADTAPIKAAPPHKLRPARHVPPRNSTQATKPSTASGRITGR